MQKAFTLLELLVVIGIIIILTALVLPNYRSGDRNLALQRSASKLAQDLRRAQGMSMSAKEVSGQIPGGFGIYFSKGSPDSYILFADLNNSHDWNAGDFNLEPPSIKLESRIIISNLSPANFFSVVFVPPDPAVWVNNSTSSAAQIILGIVNDLSTNQIISVNNAGLIYIE